MRFSSFKLIGNVGTKTLSLMYPQKKKSQGVKCGLIGGQHVSAMFSSVDRPIQLHGRFSSRYCRTPLCQWGGAPSWMNMKFGLSCCIWGSSHSLNMSSYVIPVTVFSWRKVAQAPLYGRQHKRRLTFGETRTYCTSSLEFCFSYTHVVFVDFTAKVKVDSSPKISRLKKWTSSFHFCMLMQKE